MHARTHPRTHAIYLGWEQKVAKAYGVFMDEELSKKYDFFLDHPVSLAFPFFSVVVISLLKHHFEFHGVAWRGVSTNEQITSWG